MSPLKTERKPQRYALRKVDRDFALMVSTEYNEIPYKMLALNISFLREISDETLYGDISDGFQGDLPEYILEELPFEIPIYVSQKNNFINKSKDLVRECNEKIFYYDAEIESITIKSNKGTVILRQGDPYYHSLTTPIFKIKNEHLSKSEILNRELLSSGIEDSIRSIIHFLKASTSLKKFQIYVVLGMILVHFKIYISKPLLTKEEFEENPTEAQDYKHYLYNIVKSRMKKILKDF